MSSGPETDAAIRAFQRRHGLTVDGHVGPITWEVLWTS
ncbi:peptidoglycan-binding protein [Arthrobacter pascens]|nr:peptidoglycan-binding protein [Arthrobacter pascens]